MGKKEMNTLMILCGIIGLVMGLATLTTTILVGTGETGSTYLALVANIGQIIGAIVIFMMPSKLSAQNKQKFGNALIIFAGLCFINDVLYSTLMNTFSGFIYLVIALITYRSKFEK